MHVLSVCFYVALRNALEIPSLAKKQKCAALLLFDSEMTFRFFGIDVVDRNENSGLLHVAKSGLITVPNTFIEGDRLM